ncbi:hypothetical protein ACHHYP_15721 [Achlya hypogyna]|uniref:Bzip transcription factor n=1 Tax=Achlya hypogyna TaxID=1202772 RepID=A0A1V9YA73_ACHHY|nr:hypothetical protein ACHHYP_15721 [Achlya hypogyna]
MRRTLEDRRLMRSRAQRAYVNRRKQAFRALEATVASSTQEIARLEGRRYILQSMLARSVTMNESQFVRLMHEYVRMFENGFKRRDAVAASSQERFLRSIMSEDLAFHGHRSLDTFIRIFQQYSSTHLSFTIRFVSCSVVMDDDDSCLTATLQTVVTQRMTRQSLAVYFPHVLQDEALVQVLIGRSLAIPQTSVFWFTSDGQIAQYSATMALVPTFLTLLQSLELTNFLLETRQLDRAPTE